MEEKHSESKANRKLYRVMLCIISCVSIVGWITYVLGVYRPDTMFVNDLFGEAANFSPISEILNATSVVLQEIIFSGRFIFSVLYALQFALFSVFCILYAKGQLYRKIRKITHLYSLSFIFSFIYGTSYLVYYFPTLCLPFQISYNVYHIILEGLFLASALVIVTITLCLYLHKYSMKARIIGSILALVTLFDFSDYLFLDINIISSWIYVIIIEGMITTMHLVLFEMISSGKLLKDPSTPSLGSSS